MPTPKKKTSRSRRDMRRAHDFVVAPAVATNNNGELVRPHRASKGADGAYYYKGKQISAARD
jgi:large subunit ribosomal protein L32